MANTQADNALLAHWFKGVVSDTVRVKLERHPEFATFLQSLEISGWQQLSEADVLARWNKFISTGPRQPSGAIFYPWTLAIVAAVAAGSLALFAWALLWPAACPPAVSATAIGEQLTVQLPDGSTVFLNAVSSVEVLGDNWAAERRVRLLGEAFFQIKKNPTPFVVETLAGSVSVLGTSFDARYRGSTFEVACYTGFVQSTTHSGDKQALRAGQKSTARNGRWQQPVSAITDPWPTWMQGETRFGDAPIYEVFAEMERQYDISISASGTEGRRFSGRFVHGDLDRALRMVCESLGSQFEIENKQVLIRQKQ